MSWFSDIFTGGIGDLVNGGVKIFDELHTSGEEKLEAKLKFKALIQSFEEKTLAAEVEFSKQVTERHANDMSSDSFLSKNIRPMTLAFTLICLMLLAFLSIFSDLSDKQINALELWITPLFSTYGVMLVFYFGSRGIEKIKKMSMPTG